MHRSVVIRPNQTDLSAGERVLILRQAATVHHGGSPVERGRHPGVAGREEPLGPGGMSEMFGVGERWLCGSQLGFGRGAAKMPCSLAGVCVWS